MKKKETERQTENRRTLNEQRASAGHLADEQTLSADELNEELAEEGVSEYDTGFEFGKRYKNTPLVVIAGRPNVGKSTLFNRILHKRRAITDPTPGVTRDPITENAFINGYPVRIMDTGGFKLEREKGTMEAVLDELVVEKSLDALKKADVILLLLEAGTITGEDEEFINLLRPYWNKVIAAVNKTEGGRNETEAWNFMQYGFDNLLLISAEHGDNIPELYETLISRLDFTNVVEDDEPEQIKIAIMGKPNTGKSTLSNLLTHSEASIVSDYAGTTRDVVEGQFRFKNRRFQVLDTAGIRRKAKVTENVEYYSVTRAIKTLDRCDLVFYMLDANEGLTEQDKKVIGLAYERGRGMIFILNKWDTQDQEKKHFKKAERDIKVMFGHMDYVPVVPISAKENTGIPQLLNTAMEIYNQLTRTIDTSALNQALRDWVAAYPPPASKNAHFKARYMVQTSANPVTFLLFATRPEVVQQNYLSYLKNKIRSDLGYDKIPVILELKASRKKWQERERT